MVDQPNYEPIVQVLFENGFEGEGEHFKKGDCHVWFMGERIRLWYNIPGVDKEYIGPPLPSKNEFRKFLKEVTF